MKSDIISDTECKITKDAIKGSSTNIIPKGNVVIATRVGLGKVCLLQQDTAINQDLRGIIPIKPDSLDVRFLFWWLKSVAHIIEGEGTGATVQGVKLPFVKSLPLPYPSLSEQRRIVGILDETFEGIAKAVANAEANLNNARELFESHLNAVFSNPGPDWSETTISECFKIRSGDFLPAKKMDTSGNIDVYGGNGITGRHNASNLAGENIVIGRVGAKCGNVRYVKGDIWLTDNAFCISEYYRDFDLKFLAALLDHLNLRQFANQAAQPVISYKTIRPAELVFPNQVSEQQTIVAKLDELVAETKRLEAIYRQKLALLAELKQSLLHKAFSGEL